MAGKLRHALVVRHPDTLVATPLLAGTAVPDWAMDLVHPDDLEGAALVADDAAGDSSPVGYGPLTKAALIEAIEERNAGRDEAARLSTSGNKAELVAALVADDAAGDS